MSKTKNENREMFERYTTLLRESAESDQILDDYNAGIIDKTEMQSRMNAIRDQGGEEETSEPVAPVSAEQEEAEGTGTVYSAFQEFLEVLKTSDEEISPKWAEIAKQVFEGLGSDTKPDIDALRQQLSENGF